MGYPKWVCQVGYRDDSTEQTVNLPWDDEIDDG